ncbi:sigma-70 family RNA polymerase sigma factor [Chitinophaga niabensis]|uniref:RNA polymerase sigma factor n=1 Tax=Chitinophaga niabensis TaxID=536979 RepID=UPI0031BBA61E
MVTDEIITKGLRAGDKAALKLAFDKYFDALLIRAMQFVPAEDAQDIVQEVLIKLWNHRSSIRRDNVLGAYLFRMLRNQCLDYLEEQKRQRKHDAAAFYLSERYTDPAVKKEDNPKEQVIIRALEKVSPRNLQAIRLVYYNRLRYNDAAVAMGISPNTLRNLLVKGLNQIRKYFNSNN